MTPARAGAPLGVMVCGADLSIVAVHAPGALGRVHPSDAGARLGTVDPDLAATVGPAIRRVVRTRRAEPGVAVTAAGAAYVVGVFPVGAGPVEMVSCAFAESTPPEARGLDGAAILAGAADAVLATGADGLIRYWNVGAERLYGYAASEVIGRPLALLEPPGCDEPSAEIVGRIAAGEPEHRRDALRRRRDGTLVHVWVTATPVHDRRGHVIGVSEIGRDVGDRAAVEARLRTILDAALDATVTLDADGRVVELNAAAERLFGWPAERVVGRPATPTLWPAGRRDGVAERLDAGMAAMAGRQVEVTATRADGSRFPAQVAFAALGGRGPVLFVAHVRDISRRRRAERALQQSERNRRRILTTLMRAEAVERSRIATELHDDTVQVLAASVVVLDRVALVARRAGNTPVESAIRIARATLEEATDRTRRLMFELRPSVLMRDGLLAAVRVLGQQVGRETGARTSVQGCSLRRYDRTVEELVYRAVQEALANVRKHAHPTSIAVTLTGEEGLVRAEVCDDGLGFDVVDARSRPGAALHLGLDTLQERLLAAGGSVTIESAPGVGTCIRFAVPVERGATAGPRAGIEMSAAAER